MKTFKGTFQLPPNGGIGSFTYFDTVESPFKWMAKIELKIRNTSRMIKIERL